MLLAVDIGNTNINFGVFDGSEDSLVCTFAISSDIKRTTDEFTLLIKQMIADRINNVCITNAVISSVVPSLSNKISAALNTICNNVPFIITTGTRTGFSIKIDAQTQLGADIVSNAAAAFNFAKPPFVVVDIGTATTITTVDPKGTLIGTVIAPGAAVSLKALYSSCALLTDVSFNAPENIIGKNSRDSIQSGSFYGHVYMIDGFINKICKDLGTSVEEMCLIGTGGLADHILQYSDHMFKTVPDLTIIGAATLFYHNTKRKTN